MLSYKGIQLCTLTVLVCYPRDVQWVFFPHRLEFYATHQMTTMAASIKGQHIYWSTDWSIPG